jgi:DNA-binding PadR family transcriptional regulator
MAAERGTRQDDVEDVILEVLSDFRSQSTVEITKTVKSRIDLVAADRERAKSRPNESKVDQIIANALQARRRLCTERLIERAGIGMFRITDKGKKHLAERNADIALMAAELERLLKG